MGEQAFNLRPIRIRLEFPTETWSQAVSWWQKEDKQLETLLQGWKEQEGDEAGPELLRKSLDGLKAEGRMLQYFELRFRTYQGLVKRIGFCNCLITFSFHLIIPK